MTKTKKKNILNTILLIIYIIGIIVFMIICPDLKSRRCGWSTSPARIKGCYSNLRMLQGAVEMYNMDNDIKMDNLDIDILLNHRYLRERPSHPETSCSYHGKNIIADDFIYCDYHGDVYGKMAGLYFEKYGFGKTDFQKKLESYSEKFAVSLGWPLFIFILIFALMGFKP